jgi:hypothetical protein
MVFMGVYPAPFLDRAKQSIVAIRERVIGGEKGGTIADKIPDEKLQAVVK